jgi:hypothetical protein
MNERARITFLTKNYSALQGLRFTSFWLFLAISPWVSLLPDHRPTFIRDYTRIAMLLFCGIWIWLAGRYYRRHYGLVQSKSHSWWYPLGMVGAIAVWVLCCWLDEKNPPISFQALWWACLLGWQGLISIPNRTRRFYYGVAAIIMLVMSLLPLTGRIAASQILNADHPFGLILLNCVMVILGILDHLLLVRMFSLASADCE